MIGHDKWHESVTPFYHQHHILKLEDLIDFETAKFMFKIDKNMSPKNFLNLFAKVLQIHNQNTRSSHNNKLFWRNIGLIVCKD